jgi:putative endonuclease
MGKTQDIGREAEERAAALLERQGLLPVRRNYRCRGGEIDLVMRDGDCLVFVEVRHRSHGRFGGALYSIDEHKRRRVILAAHHYLATSGWNGPCRFDVVGFDQERQGLWIRDAFTT